MLRIVSDVRRQTKPVPDVPKVPIVPVQHGTPSKRSTAMLSSIHSKRQIKRTKNRERDR
jgi:hypothetical protein